MNFKYSLLILLFFTLTANLSAQSYKEHRGNIFFERFNYTKAIEHYTVVLEKEPANYAVMQRLAESYKYLGVDSASARYYEMYIATDSSSNHDLYNYSVVLKNLGKYDKAGEVLKEYNPTENKKNYLLSDDLAKTLQKESAMFKVTLVEASSKDMDFAPAYFGDKIIFVSSRQGTDMLHREYERDGQAYLQLFVADTAPEGQLTNVVPFDNKLNTRLHEGPVCFSPADSTMYFTRNNYKVFKGRSSSGQVNLKIYQSKFTYNQWLKNMGDKLDSIGINTNWNSDDWRRVKENTLNNKEYSVGHPSLTNDGRLMYFVSDMPGGKGGSDIYVTMRIGPNEWSEPTNLTGINTEGDEMFPFIHESGVLFFASDGLPGLGGLDIFRAEKKGEVYSDPQNMKAPINSTADDFALIADKEAKMGYFSSDRKGGKGDDDLYHVIFNNRPQFILAGTVTETATGNIIPNAEIELACNENGEKTTVKSDENGKYSTIIYLPDTYQLTCAKTDFVSHNAEVLPKELEPVNDTINLPIQLEQYGIYGYVYLKGSNERVPQVQLTISNKVSKEKIELTTNEQGEFRQILAKDTDYDLFFDKSDYFIIRDSYTTKGKAAGWTNLNEFVELAIEKIEVGKTIEIPNIYYDLSKWDIRTDAAIELDKVVEFLIDNPTINMELGSHTDARGGFKSNQRLSQKRAQSAVDYIVESGIENTRINAKGYGEKKIKNRCKDGVICSSKEHQDNRRTEIKITSF